MQKCEICGRNSASRLCNDCASWYRDQTRAKRVDTRIYAVPVSEIEADPATYQFKRDVDGNGVQTSLTGEWNVWAAGVLLVFETKEGRVFVANGHHRLAYAREIGVNLVYAHILREIEGWTRADARRLAAEANILDNKGTIYDHAAYFRHSPGYSREEISHLGISQKGWVIGKSSSDNLYGHFISQRITPDQAEAIAKTAPKDDGLQDMGIKYVLDNPRAKADEVTAYIEALRVVPRKVEQNNLFGFDDSALQNAERLGEVVRTIRKEIQERITAVRSAAKRPEIARKEGVNVSDPETILKKVEALKERLIRWAKWYVDPELTALAYERAEINRAA